LPFAAGRLHVPQPLVPDPPPLPHGLRAGFRHSCVAPFVEVAFYPPATWLPTRNQLTGAAGSREGRRHPRRSPSWNPDVPSPYNDLVPPATTSPRGTVGAPAIFPLRRQPGNGRQGSAHDV